MRSCMHQSKHNVDIRIKSRVRNIINKTKSANVMAKVSSLYGEI